MGEGLKTAAADFVGRVVVVEYGPQSSLRAIHSLRRARQAIIVQALRQTIEVGQLKRRPERDGGAAAQLRGLGWIAGHTGKRAHHEVVDAGIFLRQMRRQQAVVGMRGTVRDNPDDFRSRGIRPLVGRNLFEI